MGTLIDILNHGAKVMLLALGMALVIATGGVDLSVGAVMAIAGAVGGATHQCGARAISLVVTVTLAVSILAGVWNGMLVGAFRVQPIVATLILMVAGRGVAQLITDGQSSPLRSAPRLHGQWASAGLPSPSCWRSGCWRSPRG